jgi:hypothetical protein
MPKKRSIHLILPSGSQSMSFEYSPREDEKIDSSIENGAPYLYINRPGMITLARILMKMATGDYVAGFHVHLEKNFDSDLPECVAIILSPDDAPPYE